eukprot:CAMPEP_0178657808 /NCGR_PEP_ID=MMETSP0698-20121128/25609_1 /TAXON_ID=265572 /ORGANISM="Extubocellulus spinifer, Strain CCMP396" /LENGTH=90 /DNA_ID=CAMNT_0020300063 /DNA_START=273 /DNA_END=541 /DNA_ORIENTATION=-
MPTLGWYDCTTGCREPEVPVGEKKDVALDDAADDPAGLRCRFPWWTAAASSYREAVSSAMLCYALATDEAAAAAAAAARDEPLVTASTEV